MLKILDEHRRRTPESIEREYKNCKYLLTRFEDIQKMSGYLFCVSTNRDSLHEMCVIAEEFRQKDIPCIIMGSYQDGSMPILHYEIQPEIVLET